MRELGLEIPIEEVYNANGLSLKTLLYTWRRMYGRSYLFRRTGTD
ncbi:MAG: hypothetical protein ACLT63_05240 [Bacteroides xylanisolvens]